MVSLLIAFQTVFAVGGGIPREFHGHYKGISPLAVNGSYEESVVEFRATDDGIFWMDEVAGKKFEVHYSNEWIVDARKSPTLRQWFLSRRQTQTEVFVILQHRESKLAKIILHFRSLTFFPWVLSHFRKLPLLSVSALLGEGASSLLGVFARLSDGTPEQIERELQSQFRGLKEGLSQFAEVQAETTGSLSGPTSYVDKFDIARAEEILRLGLDTERVALIKSLGRNLWTGTDAEIRERIPLIQQVLEDDEDFRVVDEALYIFVLGGRVVDGVPLVVGFLEKIIEKPFLEDLAQTAVKAAVCLLYEAHGHVAKLIKASKAFGSTDLNEVHEVTGGKIEAENLELLSQLASAQERPHRNWTLEHHTALRRILSKIVSDRPAGFSTEVVAKAKQGLDDYPDLGECQKILVKEAADKVSTTE